MASVQVYTQAGPSKALGKRRKLTGRGAICSGFVWISLNWVPVAGQPVERGRMKQRRHPELYRLTLLPTPKQLVKRKKLDHRVSRNVYSRERGDCSQGVNLNETGYRTIWTAYWHRLGIRVESSHVREESPFSSDLGRLYATQVLRKLPWLEAILKTNRNRKWRFPAVFGLFLFGHCLILPT